MAHFPWDFREKTGFGDLVYLYAIKDGVICDQLCSVHIGTSTKPHKILQ